MLSKGEITHHIILSYMLVETQLHANCAQKLIGHHRRLVFRHPLRILLGVLVELNCVNEIPQS
jgi:hypothetical protein